MVRPLTSVKSIDSGHYFSVFYLEDGTIWSVGRNDTGQLGDGTTTNRSRAVQLINDPNSPIFQSEIINYSAGGHVLFQLKDGSVWAMGNNAKGQLGDGTTTNRFSPVGVVDGSNEFIRNITSIATGIHHSVYLTGDGMVWAAGNNSNGQLGDTNLTNHSNPVKVKNADGGTLRNITGDACGSGHSTFLRSDGTVWATGANQEGQLGDGSTIDRSNPVQVINSNGTIFSGVKDISALNSHTVYLKNDGRVWAAGKNNSGQLGDGSSQNRSNPVEVVHSGGSALSGIIGISSGSYHTVYLKSDGTVWAAGRNNFGQLGDGTTINRLNPVQVIHSNGTPLTGVKGILPGDYFAVYLMEDGTVWSAGRNNNGQLGDGSISDSSHPVQVEISGGRS